MQLTDIHYGGGLFSKKEDRMAFAAIERIVGAASPDLIILTGDNVFPIPFYRGSLNNLGSMRRVAQLMERFQIPWTTVFGNHDVESFAFSNKVKIADDLERLRYCIFRRGEKQLSGVGNSVITLSCGEVPVMALVLLDSNMYAGKSFFSGFDHIHGDQLDWYEREIAKLSSGRDLLPSLLFFHIPVTEIKEAWHRFTHGDQDVIYHFGEVGETNDYFGVPKKREHVFERLAAFGSAKGLFFGHDHLNNLSITYHGIRLTYGMSIDFLAYKNIKKCTTQRGGTLVTVRRDASFDVSHIALDELH